VCDADSGNDDTTCTQTVTVVANRDTYIPQYSLGPAHGSDVALLAGACADCLANAQGVCSASTTRGMMRPLMRFDLTSIPSTATVTSAKLTLYISAVSKPYSHTGNGYIQLFYTSVTDDWNEATARLGSNLIGNNDATTNTVGQVNDSGAGSLPGIGALNIAAGALATAIGAAVGDDGLITLSAEGTSCWTLASREHANSFFRPVLEVTYDP
jgi:hypothetical protein